MQLLLLICPSLQKEPTFTQAAFLRLLLHAQHLIQFHSLPAGMLSPNARAQHRTLALRHRFHLPSSNRAAHKDTCRCYWSCSTQQDVPWPSENVGPATCCLHVLSSVACFVTWHQPLRIEATCCLMPQQCPLCRSFVAASKIIPDLSACSPTCLASEPHMQ